MTKYEEALADISEEILDSGGVYRQTMNPYKVLKGVAEMKGLDMNGSAKRIAKFCRVDSKVVVKIAKQVLIDYHQTGVLNLPKEFQMRGKHKVFQRKDL